MLLLDTEKVAHRDERKEAMPGVPLQQNCSIFHGNLICAMDNFWCSLHLEYLLSAALGAAPPRGLAATFLRIWPSFLPSFFWPCLLRLIHNKRESSREGGGKEGARALAVACPSPLCPPSLPLSLFPYSHLYLICTCMGIRNALDMLARPRTRPSRRASPAGAALNIGDGWSEEKEESYFKRLPFMWLRFIINSCLLNESTQPEGESEKNIMASGTVGGSCRSLIHSFFSRQKKVTKLNSANIALFASIASIK